MSPYEEAKAEFTRNLKHPMSPEAEAVFDEIYQMTIEPSLATASWEGAGRNWVLKQVGKIARRAQSETPDAGISRNALARAANFQIPLASEACQFGKAMEGDKEPGKEEFGVFCVAFVPLAIL